MGERAIALVYSKNAELAGSRGASPSHYAPGQARGARQIAGSADLVDAVPDVPPSPDLPSCSSTTRAGTACKALPVRGSDLCIGHTNQKAAQT